MCIYIYICKFLPPSAEFCPSTGADCNTQMNRPEVSYKCMHSILHWVGRQNCVKSHTEK